MDDDIDYVDEYYKLTKQLAALSWARWIPVAERLPDESEIVSILISDSVIPTYAFLQDATWYSIVLSGFETRENGLLVHLRTTYNLSDIPVICWMSLPPGRDV